MALPEQIHQFGEGFDYNLCILFQGRVLGAMFLYGLTHDVSNDADASGLNNKHWATG